MNNNAEETIKRIQRFGLDADIETQDGVRHFHRGHEYVEIGGVKWATMNIGANSPYEGGLYFQWADTKGWSAEQVSNYEKCFDWYNYKFYQRGNFCKYDSIVDGKNVLDLEDDAVHAHWGGKWRMPTYADYATLCNAVTTEWTADYQGSGVAGLVCTDKTDSSKVLFFPACGRCYNGKFYEVGISGYYWSSSLYTSNVQYTYYLRFASSGMNWQDYSNRRNGFLMRGVVD